MSRDQAENIQPLDDISQLSAWFRQHEKGPDAVLGVGTEHEKFGYDAETGAPLGFEGPRGIEATLRGLADRFGWSPVLDDGRVLALERDGAAVTLEPGGQLELSGRITRTTHETASELNTHLEELQEVGADLGQRWTMMAISPWDTPADIPWMPKSRYAVMKRYLPTRGARAHWMMKATCTVQSNYDFRDEADAFDALRLLTRWGPVVSALFSNSPVERGARTGMASGRNAVWEETDPDRCVLPACYLDEGATYGDLVEWAVDVPMFFVVRDGRYVDTSGVPFRALLEGRVEGLSPRMGDWELHLSTLFPPTRMKGYLEVRVADAGPRSSVLALPALWRGLLYDVDARRAAHAAVAGIDAGSAGLGSAVARESGLAGVWRGRTLRDWADELLTLSAEGLARLAEGEESDARYLDALRDASGAPRAPGERFLEVWEACGGDRLAVQRAYALDGPESA